MLQAKCIKKFRDKHNKIIGYRLVDTNGNIQDVKAEKLKEVLSTGKLNIVNLTLTKDGRLVNTSENDTKSGIVNKAKNVIHQPQPKQTTTILKDHQPILFCGLLDDLDLDLRETELLNFKIVDSLSSILNKVKALGVGVDKITDDMYMIYNTNNKTATIVSEAPVRVLAEEKVVLGNLFKTIDFKNVDLSHIKSLDNIVGKTSSTKVVQHSLDEIKKINHSVVSRYKYRKPDPFNNKEADRGLAVANTLCSIWTWAWADEWDVDTLFDDFTTNACDRLKEAYGLYGLGRQGTSYILDLLELNWDDITSVDNMSYSEATAAWAISRVLATHDLMSHLDTIVKGYTDPIFYALTNKNIELAMDGDIIKDSVLSAFDYDIEGTYDGLMYILREKIDNYGSQKFLNNLETCIKYFKSTGDIRALAHFSEIYKCVSGIINEVNTAAKNKKKEIEDSLKQINSLLGEKFNVHIKTQKSSNDFGMLHYEAITDKLFTVDDKVAEVLDLDDDLIGANVCIFATIKYNVIGEGFEEGEDEDTLLEIVVESSEKDDSTTLIGHTSTDYYSIISFDDLQNSIDELKEGYNQLMEELGVKKN